MNSLVMNSLVNSKKALLVACALLACAPLATAERDPTRPIAYKPPAISQQQHSGLKLDSLLVSKQRRHASINGTLVEEGDRIAGVRIVAISTSGVTIERNGKRQLLSLHTNTIKTSAVKTTKRDRSGGTK
ncbi:hypothetical protein KFE80_10070 [bacterium SCSIO 12696]|nr:hypothetical protein KFE80_10070 [bacterium SCSIO 12696]